MKIKESDLQDLPMKKEFFSVLKRLNQLKDGESPHHLFESLMMLISRTMAGDSVPILFPYLVELALKSTDFSYLNFVVNMKLGFYHRGDLNLLDDDQILEYVQGLLRLRQTMPLHPPKDAQQWPEEFKSIYLWNAMLLYSHSPDLLVLSRQGQFSAPFKVKCPHCGNDIHSLHIDAADLSRSSHITPAAAPEKSKGLFPFDDVYRGFYHILEDFQEKHFSKILPYVYGSYECTVCNQKSVVMDAIKCYQFVEDKPYIPDESFLNRLEGLIFNQSAGVVSEKWILTSFAVSMHRSAYGLESLQAILVAVRAVRGFTLLGVLESSGEVGQEVLEEALLLLEKNPEKTLLRGKTLRYVALLLQQLHKEKGAEVIALYEESLAIFTEELGAEAEESRGVALNLAVQRSYETESLLPLEEMYEKIDREKEFDTAERLEAFLQEGHAMRNEFEQAIFYKKRQIQHIIREYGEESDVFADITRELGKLHLKNQEIDLASACFQQAFQIHINELGREYLLPPLLRNLAHGAKKLTKKAKEDAELGDRARSASQSLMDLGDIAFGAGEYEQALKQYQKARELWDWVTDIRFVESGVHCLVIALAQEKLGDQKSAKEFSKKAIQIFQIRQKESAYEQEKEKAQQYMERAEDLLKRL